MKLAERLGRTLAELEDTMDEFEYEAWKMLNNVEGQEAERARQQAEG